MEFEAIVPVLNYYWKEYYSNFMFQGKLWQRISYNCKTGKASLRKDKLLFILYYFKNRPLQEYRRATDEIIQPRCN